MAESELFQTNGSTEVVQTNGSAKLNHEPSSLVSDEHNIEFTDSHTSKRDADSAGLDQTEDRDKRRKGTAPIKEEYLIKHEAGDPIEPKPGGDEADDDAAEAFHHNDRPASGNNAKSKRREKNKGQNKAREFGSSRDEIGLCSSRSNKSEFSPNDCQFGDKCKFEHDIRVYLKAKREDLSTFNSICPVYEVKGQCAVGWKCRFVGSHSKEIEHEDGRKELVLMEDAERIAKYPTTAGEDESQPGVVNVISTADRISLTRKKFDTPKSNTYLPWLDSQLQNPSDQGRQENRASFVDPPLLPSEKRRIYFGAETPVLAPLTTQGNLPFRRLCNSLGASFTYSEMAMSLPLIQGQRSEWALIKAHESEIQPPTFTTASTPNIVYDYNQSHDLKFGAQIAANKPWMAIKATEVLTTLLPTGLRVVDLNCGCPIDLVYREGAGSALMDSPAKLEKILRGMNVVSGATPITVKIRTGTKDKNPTAQKLVNRLVLGNEHSLGDPCGVAAITLHGRSRQQRYTKSADWEYIKSTANLISSLNDRAASLTDTSREPDARQQANTSSSSSTSSDRKKVFFLGNGDVYSHTHYNNHIEHAGVDAVMLARGALIKPWIFEEIASNQYLDKTSTERLAYIEQFCRFGLEAWGSDEIGVGQTRRFLLEWLSFACRYIPVGLLEYLPPNMNDRPPRYKGRDELETLMASDNYKDWIKISEMFLGPAHKDFRFEPKHKSHSYEAEG